MTTQSQMLTDIGDGDKLFGVSYFDSTTATNDVPPAGHVGCVAEVTQTQVFPDGRSNILTLGVVRYRIESYVERGDPYLVAIRPLCSTFRGLDTARDLLLRLDHAPTGCHRLR